MDTAVVSLFKAPVTNKYPNENMTLSQVFGYIVGTRAKNATMHLRSIEDRAEARKFKGKSFDFVTPSGVFNYHSDASLVSHSGLICIDFDHVKDIHALKTTLLHDPYFESELLFTSPSGDGIKWWVPIDIQKRPHEVWFKAMQNYLNATYGLEADPQCVNVSRACFLPYDPNCYVNPNICPF